MEGLSRKKDGTRDLLGNKRIIFKPGHLLLVGKGRARLCHAPLLPPLPLEDGERKVKTATGLSVKCRKGITGF